MNGLVGGTTSGTTSVRGGIEMTAPESFAELAELFDRGWRIATLAVDVREERAFVRITLERRDTENPR